MKRVVFFLMVLSIWSCQNKNQHPLSLSENGHFLLKNKQAFFWLGDTAWELFHRLNREEAELYLQTRADQGFNVIQAVILPELDAFTLPNAYGDFPLIDGNISKINSTPGKDPNNAGEYDYFDHVEWIIQSADTKNLMVGVLPCWGEYVTPRKRERTISTPDQAYEYGWFIGNRLNHLNDNIIWILGGDRLPDEESNGVECWRAMAEGITDAINGEKGFDQIANYQSTFMTYHCYRSSSEWFHGDEWIDIHTWGSYHEKRDNERAYSVAGKDRKLDNPIPTLNSEPAYEKLPVNYDWETAKNGYFDDFDIRQHAYWSVFSGTCGHSYGAHPVWQMHKDQLNHKALAPTTHFNWEQGLFFPGGQQMQHLKNLILSRAFQESEPYQDLLADNTSEPAKHCRAIKGNRFAMVYVPSGEMVTINTHLLGRSTLKAWWFNPRNGKTFELETFSNVQTKQFKVPGELNRGNDWILVIDQDRDGLLAPGQMGT